MSDIYQQIWDADQAQNGISAILDTTSGDPAHGYVKVNSRLHLDDPTLKVLPEVVIPGHKQSTYRLCRELFDNYALPERDPENETAEEREEVHDLVHAMVDTAPMLLARDYVAQSSGTSLTRERWYNTIMEMWFRRFSLGGDPHLSGFEHVVVGEQQGSKAQGYHFWYKYHLDDGFAHLVDDAQERFPGLVDDRIAYLGSRLADGQAQFPESVTISYRWQAPDYEREAMRPLTKPVGGFFVGCSVEGLLALGTVRAHLGARAPKEAQINGGRYSLKLFRSADNLHVRTFYPVFLGGTRPTQPGEPSPPPIEPTPGPAPQPPPVASTLRIIAALVNPHGHDPGNESVTLINTGSEPLVLDDWRLEDKNGRSQVLQGLRLEGGDTLRVRLDPAGAQLSNQGGRIALLSPTGQVAHAVTYSKGQASQSGNTLLF
ncbi:MAG: hypothetical protein KDK91_04885 [Gammaproteobacteria bacterium]|nr:hypothetical protein [Gammaproteobacteria bacterium]